MKKTILMLSVPLLLSAHSMGELFDALKHHSQTKSDEMVIQKAKVAASQATANLYPTINLFGSFDNYSTPTGLVPVPPDTLVGLVQKSSTQPFSYNIYKAGANFSMPIFVKSIYSSADKARALQKSAKAKKKINLLQNEAIIVGSNASLEYLQALKKSLDVKEQSLLETQKTLKIKVENGRSPASSLYKINDSLNQVSIAKNSIDLQKQKLISSIETLTGIRLELPIAMKEASQIESGVLASLEPLQERVKASRIGVRIEKEKLYPTVLAHGSYAFSSATAYNNAQDVNERYGDIGIVINIPLLSMSQYESIAKSKIELRSDEIALDKLGDELHSKANMLQSSLPLLDNSIRLSHESVANKQKLLEIAKVNYKSGRLSTEEYLRYEDDVVSAKAKLYEAKAQKWQTMMELAVIYANNIEEIVK